MYNEMGEITISGADLDGKPILGTVTYPFYACGHCSASVVMRPDRSRERKRCLSCGRWICETNELCNTDCTPLYSLADDHFEGATKWTGKVNAIMTGVTTLKDAFMKGIWKNG